MHGILTYVTELSDLIGSLLLTAITASEAWRRFRPPSR